MQPIQQSQLQYVIEDLGLSPCYHLNGRNFFDVREVFDRHNFARDVRRNVKEEDWIYVKPRYLLSEHGIVQYAFKKGVAPIVDRLMAVFDLPFLPQQHTLIKGAKRALPSPQLVQDPSKDEVRQFTSIGGAACHRPSSQQQHDLNYASGWDAMPFELMPDEFSALSLPEPYPNLTPFQQEDYAPPPKRARSSAQASSSESAHAYASQGYYFAY